MEIDDISKDFLKRSEEWHEQQHAEDFVSYDEVLDYVRSDYLHTLANLLVMNRMKKQEENQEMEFHKYTDLIGCVEWFMEHITLWPKQIVDPPNVFVYNPNELVRVDSIPQINRVLNYAIEFDAYIEDYESNHLTRFIIKSDGPLKSFAIDRTEEWSSANGNRRILYEP